MRAKEATSRLVNYKHGLRNSLIPILTLIGLQFGALLGGTVILESIFGLPGHRLHGLPGGSSSGTTRSSRPGPCSTATIFVAVNIAVDIAYGFIDPRVRRS